MLFRFSPTCILDKKKSIWLNIRTYSFTHQSTDSLFYLQYLYINAHSKVYMLLFEQNESSNIFLHIRKNITANLGILLEYSSTSLIKQAFFYKVGMICNILWNDTSLTETVFFSSVFGYAIIHLLSFAIYKSLEFVLMMWVMTNNRNLNNLYACKLIPVIIYVTPFTRIFDKNKPGFTLPAYEWNTDFTFNFIRKNVK